MNTSPEVSSKEFWEGVLKSHWGIDAKLNSLPGELDQNFLAQEKNGSKYILKIMRTDCPDWLIKAQIESIEKINTKDPSLKAPKIVKSLQGTQFIIQTDQAGNARVLWVQSYIPGKCYAEIKQKTTDLSFSIGVTLGGIGKALADYQNENLVREFRWYLPGSLWLENHFEVIENSERHGIISKIVKDFKEVLPKLSNLASQIIHNDPNDYNILISGDNYRPLNVSGIVDFGDICQAPRICDLAIAAAYIVLDHPDPEKMLAALVSGYNSIYPLSTQEVDIIWRLLRMRLAVSVVNSTLLAAESPSDDYITISQAPAWRFLEKLDFNEGLIRARLRSVCDMPIVEGADRVLNWISKEKGKFAPLFGVSLKNLEMKSLSAEKISVPENPFELDNSGNIIPEILYSNINLVEQFNPLIRLDIELKNSFKLLADFKKDRALSLSLDNSLLTESIGDEYTLGLGYRVKDVRFRTNFGGKKITLKGDLNIKADFSYRNNVTVLRNLEYDNNQVTAGQKLMSIKITADYAISKNITSLFFYDHNFSKFAISTAFPQTSIRSGITIRYNFGN